jgi:DNA-binding GntR family transcriptional regulator
VAIERIQQHTMPDNAARVLRNAILDGTLAPGSQLRETHIAADLGISRAPLREALHRLEEEGLVVRVPFRGAFVAEVSRRVAAEIEALRAVLEPYAVECALPRLATPEGRAELAQAVHTLDERAAAGDRAGAIDAHLAVHRALYRASGNQVLCDMWDSWESQLRLFLAVDHQLFTNLTDVAEPHERLLELIEAGDIKSIRRELVGHIHPTLPDVPATTAKARQTQAAPARRSAPAKIAKPTATRTKAAAVKG